MQCTECGADISMSDLYDKFPLLFDGIDSDMDFKYSDLEESIYFGTYCTQCAERFTLDESDD